jgi:hypothetical protein
MQCTRSSTADVDQMPSVKWIPLCIGVVAAIETIPQRRHLRFSRTHSRLRAGALAPRPGGAMTPRAACARAACARAALPARTPQPCARRSRARAAAVRSRSRCAATTDASVEARAQAREPRRARTRRLRTGAPEPRPAGEIAECPRLARTRLRPRPVGFRNRDHRMRHLAHARGTRRTRIRRVRAGSQGRDSGVRETPPA